MEPNPEVRSANLSPVERLLNLFTEVRPGEGASVLALTLDIFLILTAYYLIKPVREALILSSPGGAELKSYASAGQALLLLAAVPAYGWLAGRVRRMRLIDSVTLFFAACLIVFYLLIRAGAPMAVPFFLWVGIFNLMVPAQLWAFANDLYTTEAGKRLFVLIAFGASAGAVFGSLVADEVIAVAGVYEMLPMAAGILASTLLLSHYVDRRERSSRSAAAEAEAEEPMESGGAFSLVFRNRYLLLLAFMLLFNNWVNSSGEYILGRIVRDAAEAAAAGSDAVASEEFIASFYSQFFAAVNLSGLLLQLFAVSRVVKYVGVPIALCMLPALSLGSYGMIAALPALGVVRWMKTAENSTDYSLQSTVKQMLYLPTTRAEKYKAKQAIDTFFVRAGDVLAACLVFLGTQIFAFGVSQFAIATLALGVFWLLLSIELGRRFREKVPREAERTS